MKSRARTLQRPRHVEQSRRSLNSSQIFSPLAPRVQEAARKRVLKRQVVIRQKRRAVVPLEKADPETEECAALVSPRVTRKKARGLARGAGGGQDESTETEEAEALGELRRHQRADRRKKRLDQHHLRNADFPFLTFLESEAVSVGTIETYKESVRDFLAWADGVSCPLTSDLEIDAAVVRWMNYMYQQGHRAWKGERLIAGLPGLAAEFGKQGPRNLPRSHRALAGWRKRCPGHSRRPLSWPVWAAIACELCRAGEVLMGVMVLMSVLAYLRPSEALGLTSRSLLPPTAHGVKSWVVWLFPSEERQRSKTGEADDTIAMDGRRAPWMARVYQVLSEKGSGEALFGCSYLDFASALASACRRLNLKVVGYQMRHSGASMDRADGSRSLEAVQKRGRWQAQKSVRRYEKHGRLNESWKSLSASQQSYFEKCEKLLEGVIVGGVPPPSLPLQW